MASRDNTAQLCQEIVLKILDLSNNYPKDIHGSPVQFDRNFGGNTITVFTPDTHFHVGVPDETYSFQTFVEELHKAICSE